jgi:hypothetical protein
VTRYIIPGIILLNYVAVNAGVRLGLSFEDVSLLFQERQAMTFVSALQLGIISVLSVCIYAIKRLLYKGDARRLRLGKVWIISFFLFAFAAMDEFFMIHEGIDGDIATFFWGIKENPHLDGLTLALYGAVALALFFKFKSEILRHRAALPLFITGGFFFILSIGLDLKTVEQFKLILEESSKLFAVGFLLSGYVVVFHNAIKELESKLV